MWLFNAFVCRIWSTDSATPHPSRCACHLLAAARSRRGSDSPPDCHSIPRRRFATQEKPGEQGYALSEIFLLRRMWNFCFAQMKYSVCDVKVEICWSKFLSIERILYSYALAITKILQTIPIIHTFSFIELKFALANFYLYISSFTEYVIHTSAGTSDAKHISFA